ncbi:hypothetical protein [Kitasatospora sp. NPDC005856]|uniref:hypothetical protein n=1 Tax=Kitasatospora sp. NPDC005856 TaxID=3154566 RepID=UPI00340C1CF7
MFDLDGDQIVSRTECLARVDRVAAALGVPAHAPVVAEARRAREAVWRDMDTDRDGPVRRDDHLAAIRDFVVTGISAMAPAYGTEALSQAH